MPAQSWKWHVCLTYNRHALMPTFLKTIMNGPLDVPWSILALLGGFALLLLGGHWLVQGSVAIAHRKGISMLVIGLTIVAFGTSAPELALNVVAAASGETALAFGNVIGSNIANIGLVIGLCALVAPLAVNSRIIRLELPWLIVVTLVFMLLIWIPPDVAGHMGMGRIDGAAMVLATVLIALHWYRIGRRENQDGLSTESMQECKSQAVPLGNKPLLCWIALIGGLVLLVVGGKAAEQGAVSIATHLQIHEVVIGLTIVAIATTLPEIITCVIASRRGHADLAIGTVVGSNLFNLSLVMGITSLVKPVQLPPDGWMAILAMLFFTMLLWPLARSKRTVGRLEGALLLLLYIAIIGWTAFRQIQTSAS
jgi:cation:H+ antiporter